MLLHIGGFQLDIDSQRHSPWQHLTPQTRILASVLGVFAIALTPNGHWWTWAIYGLGLVGLILAARVTLPVLLKRVAVEFVFVGVVLIGTLFRGGGEVLWSWGPFQITTVGLVILGSVSLKAFLSLLMLNLLILTTSVPALLHGLTVLRTPQLLVAILASMYRYLGVLIDEFSSMRRAAAARNLTGSSHWQRLVVGNMIGSLFIRTYERGERVSQAMLARGYTGQPPVENIPQRGWQDILALTLTILVALLGQFLYWPLNF